MEQKKQNRVYLFDLDGTLTIDNEAAPYAVELIHLLNNSKKEFFIITNGCTMTSRKISRKLEALCMDVPEERIITSVEIMICFLENHYKEKKLFLLGAPWFRKILMQKGFHLTARHPDAVIVSYDPGITWAGMERAVRYIDEGADYLSVNDDLFIPGISHHYPHTGMVNYVITKMVCRSPLVTGKPAAYFMEEIRRRMPREPDSFCMVGDTLSTDMVFAENCGIEACLVLTGTSKQETALAENMKFCHICPNLRDLLDKEKKGQKIVRREKKWKRNILSDMSGPTC